MFGDVDPYCLGFHAHTLDVAGAEGLSAGSPREFCTAGGSPPQVIRGRVGCRRPRVQSVGGKSIVPTPPSARNDFS